MIIPANSSHLPWFLRTIALALGVAAFVAGVLLASEFEEILVGTPLFFLGGLGVACGVKGYSPSRRRTSKG